MFDWLKKRRKGSVSSSGSPLLNNLWADEANVLSVKRPVCHCLDAQYEDNRKWRELSLHSEVQDTNCPAWHKLLELIDRAAADGREEFSPGREMDASEWTQIVTLPPSIAKLKSVKHLVLYGSSLVRIPPAIGEMTSLEVFSPYTSSRLHWFPYEITRCKKLRDSTVSTRVLYGNYKYRPPFPRLPQILPELLPDHCSVCEGPFQDSPPHQVWISLPVATDVLPLLVHACSEECIKRLPVLPWEQTRGPRYIAGPHEGGLGLTQPGAY